MNESALNAITAPQRNDRQEWVVAIARQCLAQYPRVLHADERRVFTQISILLSHCSPDLSKVLQESEYTIGRFVNDVTDVWQAFIDDRTLLKK